MIHGRPDRRRTAQKDIREFDDTEEAAGERTENTNLGVTTVETGNGTESQIPFFDWLPSEIRLKIWRLAIPRRVIAVQTFQESFPWAYRLEGRLLPHPTVLQLCHESRSEVMSSYTKFRNYPDILKSYPLLGYDQFPEREKEKCIYVSICHDTFFFRSNLFPFDEVISGFMPKIYKANSLAIDIDFGFHSNLYQILHTKFPKLKELLFVAPQRHDWDVTCGAIILEDLDTNYSCEYLERNRTFQEVFKKYRRLGDNPDGPVVEKLEPVCPRVSLAKMKSDFTRESNHLYPVFSKIFDNEFAWPEDLPDYLVRRINAHNLDMHFDTIW